MKKLHKTMHTKSGRIDKRKHKSSLEGRMGLRGFLILLLMILTFGFAGIMLDS